MKPCRLSIWIKKKPVLQGKFYYLDGKPTFLFNVDKNKFMEIYQGYGIAEQVLRGFEKAKIRGLQIIAKNTDNHTSYITNRSRLYKKGIKNFFGGHTQWFLPLKNWKVFKDSLEEPYGLPRKTIEEWFKSNKMEDCSPPIDVLERLREEAKRQGWYGFDKVARKV